MRAGDGIGAEDDEVVKAERGEVFLRKALVSVGGLVSTVMDMTNNAYLR